MWSRFVRSTLECGGKATALGGRWNCDDSQRVMLARSSRSSPFPSLPKRWLDRHRTPKLREICRESRKHAVAREGALGNPAPRFARGKRASTKFVAAEAATGKCSRRARSCSGRLRGRYTVVSLLPRAERGAGLASAPPRAA